MSDITHPTRYTFVELDDVRVFYREAGPEQAPVVLLLHGFPTSSHMYRDLIPGLSRQYRVIAPDLPGFGYTEAPPRGQFEYTFEALYRIIEAFTEALALDRYALMVFDYGAPVGFRLAAANPARVTALISQSGNAYREGLLDSWNPFRAYWEDPESADRRNDLRTVLTRDTTRFQYTHGVPEDRLTRISPDAMAHDQAILDRDPEVQLDLFRDYKSNVDRYPHWQDYLRRHRPPLLATWGKNDPFFGPDGARAFARDVPDAEIHLFDTGHFALETHRPEIEALVLDFLKRKVLRLPR